MTSIQEIIPKEEVSSSFYERFFILFSETIWTQIDSEKKGELLLDYAKCIIEQSKLEESDRTYNISNAGKFLKSLNEKTLAEVWNSKIDEFYQYCRKNPIELNADSFSLLRYIIETSNNEIKSNIIELVKNSIHDSDERYTTEELNEIKESLKNNDFNELLIYIKDSMFVEDYLNNYNEENKEEMQKRICKKIFSAVPQNEKLNFLKNTNIRIYF